MRRQLATKLLARRSLHSNIRIARLWQTAPSCRNVLPCASSSKLGASFRECKRSYTDSAAGSSKTANPAINPNVGFETHEADRKKIHSILFPSIPTHLIPGPIKNANLDPVRAVGLSSAEVLEIVSIMVPLLQKLERKVVARDVKRDGFSIDTEAVEAMEEPQAHDTPERPAIAGADDPAGETRVGDSASGKPKQRKLTNFRADRRLNLELSVRFAEISDTMGSYVPHMANSLGLYIREASPEALVENEVRLEQVARWCYVHSFDGSHMQGRSSSSLRDFHIAGKLQKKEPVLGANKLAGSAAGLVKERENLVRRAQSAYEELLSRWTKQAIADRAASSEAGVKAAEKILRSIEDTFWDVARQLAIVNGVGINSSMAIHVKTRQLLAGSLKERFRVPMQELLALWTRISFEFGTPGVPLRAMLPKETLNLGLIRLLRGVYPDESRIWTDAIDRSKIPATHDAAQSTERGDRAGVSAMQAFTEQLVSSAYMRSQDHLRRIVRAAASRSDLDYVLELWKIAKDRFEKHSSAMLPDNLETLCVFLQVLLRARSFGQEVPEVKKALEEIFAFFPNPTPLPIYHTILSVYSGRYNTAMAKDFSERSGGSGDENVMLKNLKITWERMKTDGVTRDLAAYKLAIVGFGAHGDFDAVRMCWKDLAEDEECRRLWIEQSGSKQPGPFPPIEMVNVFMTTFLNSPKASGAAETAIGMFETICDPKTPYKPDIVSINIMLKHYVAKNDITAMSSLMAKLSSMGLKPDVVTYTTIVDGLLKSGRREVARDTLDLMHADGVQPSSYTYGLLIGDLARSGTRDDMARADALVKRMRLSKLTPSTVTYTALLGGYFRAGMVPQALTILKQMERDGIDMDIVTYNMILRSIVNSNVDAQVKKAVKRVGGNVGGSPSGFWRTIIDAMLARRIAPNDDTWFIILSGMLRAHRFEEGDAVIEEMHRQEFRPRPASSLERCVDDIRQRKFVRPRSVNVRRTRR